MWRTIPLLGLLLALAAPAGAQLQPRIVNGVATFGYPTAGALLAGADPDRAYLECSGTLIGCSTFVTAAHCVCDLTGASCQSGSGAPRPGDWLVFFQNAGFFAVQSIAVQPGFDFPADDVAVLTLATPVTGIPPTSLVSAEPALGSDGTLVGFGRSGGGKDDYGLKQRGSVVTASCGGSLPDGLVCWNFQNPVGPPGADSNTCNGDSGGPLFQDLGSGPLLAGITSGGNSFDCLANDMSYDTSVAFQRAWIESRGGSDLGGASCGSLSQVGDAATEVVGFTQKLDAQKTEGTHSFEVAGDVTELRVALNASEESGADVDLYVRFGSPPTTSEWDCRAFGSGQWGFCDFPAPAAGTWYVLVERYSGASTYQVTATLLRGEGAPPPPPPVAGAQTHAQRRCLNGLAEAGAAVTRAQAGGVDACLRAFARGRTAKLGRGAQTRTADACLGNDVSGRVSRALERTLGRDERRCQARPEQLPDFAYRGAGPVNGAARGQATALTEDLFGPSLDPTLVERSAAPRAAACQEAVAKGAGGVVEAATRLSAGALRDALRGRGPAAPAASSAGVEAAILSAFAADGGSRLTRARERLQRRVGGRCAATESPLATLFPGVCGTVTSSAELADCADRVALCRACQAQNAMAGLALDCDLFDDGLPDLTCP
jgi:Trypsin/Bacterial pre-peptidase C-terminal domain